MCLVVFGGIVLLLAPACALVEARPSPISAVDLESTRQAAELGRSPGPASTPGTPDVAAAADLADRLKARGLSVREIDASATDAEPFLRSPKVGYVANGVSLYVFPYADDAQAQAAARRVPPDADDGHWDWAKDAFFYRCGRLIVLQFGQDETVAKALTDLCGSPFAAGKKRF